MFLRALTAIAVTAALLGGCGDDDGTKGGDQSARLKRVEACLERLYSGFVSTQKTDLDRVALAAKGGAVSVHTEDQELNVSLQESPRAARLAERIYRGYDASPALVERRGSLVISYTREPTRRERRQIDPCISA